jgi:diguanylate cyclase (GGDEF)-like protein
MFSLTRQRWLGSPWAVTLGVLSLAFGVLGLSTDGTNWPLVGVAALFAGSLVALAWSLARSQLPVAVLLILPVGCDLVIAGVRQAQGGSMSGYSPLAILPVVWVGLAFGRRAVWLITAVTAAMFALPIVVIGAPMYPDSGWRGVVLWVIVAFVVGTGARRVMASQRFQTSLATSRAVELDRLVATQNTIATARFDVNATLDTVVEQALMLTGGEGAVVELPEGDDMVYTAGAGAAVAHVGTRLSRAGSMSGLALETSQTLHCRDGETDPRVDRQATAMVGARSMIVVPLVHDGHATGVLKVYSGRVHAFDEHQAAVLELLASMIAAALVRAALMHRLSQEARTDELTGLLNRREWDQRLDLALARSRRSGQPVSVLLMDVDELKAVNDRDGHSAGDQYLQDVSRAWAGAIRETDALGRIGGDEFGVLLEGADARAAQEAARRMSAALGDAHRASIGVATWDAAEDAAALVARADAEMYAQKRRGRAQRAA